LDNNSKKQYSFSIIIPCRNERNYIENCLISIVNQSYDPNLIEVIIVDAFSNDGTRDLVSKFQTKYPHIKMLDNPKKKTPQALNIGIKNSGGEIVVILGAHTEIDRNFISYNNKFHVEKNVLVTGGTQTNVGKSIVQRLVGMVNGNPFCYG